jgi:hypothetical protein
MLTNFLKNFYPQAFGEIKDSLPINLLGLSIGMAAAILILLWIQNEVSTDRFYTRKTGST